MKKHLQLSFILLALGAFLFAQEKTEVSIKVTKDGKVVKDTTYTFDDAAEAKHAIHMMDAMASEELNLYFHDSDEHKMHMKKEGDHKMHSKTMMFISEDGKKVKVENLDKDHMEWHTSSVSEDGETEKIIIMKSKGDVHGKTHVYITSGDDDEMEKKIEVIVKEYKVGDCGNAKIKKEIIIISDGEEGEDIEWTINEHVKGDNVEVIVIKKGKDDQDIEVEVKKIKEKKKRKSSTAKTKEDNAKKN